MTRIHPLAVKRVRKLRVDMSDAEKRLWRHLRKRQVGGYRFRRQHPLGRYIVDFVCLEAKLVVEVDGGQHAERAKYDRQRSSWLEQNGYRVLRFWNHEVLDETDAVLLAIGQVIDGTAQPPSQPFPLPGGRGPKGSVGRLGWAAIDASVQSWIGHAQHADSEGLRQGIFSRIIFQRGTDREVTSA